MNLVRLVILDLANVCLELAAGSQKGNLNLAALVDIGVEDNIVEVEVVAAAKVLAEDAATCYDAVVVAIGLVMRTIQSL